MKTLFKYTRLSFIALAVSMALAIIAPSMLNSACDTGNPGSPNYCNITSYQCGWLGVQWVSPGYTYVCSNAVHPHQQILYCCVCAWENYTCFGSSTVKSRAAVAYQIENYWCTGDIVPSTEWPCVPAN